MTDGPRLSIGLPVYNGERFLEVAVDSLLRQSFADFELVICDNASTDRTPEIIASLMARDRRIRSHRNDVNIGASPNFTKVATLTSAPFFKWAAHDDLYEASYLDTCMRTLDARPDVVLAHSDSIFIDESGAAFGPGSRPGLYLCPRTGLELPVDRVDLAETGTPLQRFSDVVFNSTLGSHMFGVVRRTALERTHLIQNIPSSDRPFLAELALLGPFQQSRARLFQKRFHGAMTFALHNAEVRAYVSGSSARYSTRARKLKVYFGLPFGKPISALAKAGCLGVVAAYSAKVAARSLLQRQKNRQRIDAWREKPTTDKANPGRSTAN